MSYIPGPGDFETWGAYNGNPADPRHDDDYYLDEIEAEGQATDELEATPRAVADWLNDEAMDAADPVAVFRVEIEEVCEQTTPVLLALLFAGTDQQALRAREELRERFAKAHQDDINERAKELMKEPQQ